MLQFNLQIQPTAAQLTGNYRERFKTSLSGELDFHGKSSAYASHQFHAFPAKFPPQLPRKFIEELTAPGDVVLDPMAGSGTTLVEAFLAGRRGIGLDIDPLALRMCRTKVTPLAWEEVVIAGQAVVARAEQAMQHQSAALEEEFQRRYAPPEREFIEYWFSPTTRLELLALLREIEQSAGLSAEIRLFLEMVFSAIIITKSGGVSLARDLAHTRPHRVTDKAPRSAFADYRRRLQKNGENLPALSAGTGSVTLLRSDAQRIALADHTVDLIVTSPPYAANAIDYLRAHKFSLVWWGHSLASLANLRRESIGHDAVARNSITRDSIAHAAPVPLPDIPAQIVATLDAVDHKKAQVLRRYYSEMTHALAEMYRVLKPGKAAVVVVGSSMMRGIDTQTGVCLGEIGKQSGFDLVEIGVRALDRDKRMMPARQPAKATDNQIEQRMHEEYVIGLLKPGGAESYDSETTETQLS